MKILVTGANGFIGKNLVASLETIPTVDEIYSCDIQTTNEELERYCKDCNIVYHLAGVNRSIENNAYMKGNRDFTKEVLSYLEKAENKSPFIMTSSIHVERDDLYGESKKAGEEIVLEYSERTGNSVYIYRLPNVFGKWSRPNYNSVVATFCYNIARELPIKITDREIKLTLVYIDDVIADLVNFVKETSFLKEGKYRKILTTYEISLGKLADLIMSFSQSRKSLEVPEVKDALTKKLYSTYLSFLPKDSFSYRMVAHKDTRGVFAEVFRLNGGGQVSVNISKPGVLKGGHWHHTKIEKFIVVSGTAEVYFRDYFSNETITYNLSDENLEVLDIPPGYVHSIKNTGNTDLVTIIWANEWYNRELPDTFSKEV